MTLSVCIIVKDEALVIGRCLDCVKKFADEIIVVDTGSTDDTKAIASKYTDKIYDFEWVFDFAKARNFSFSKATCDLVMWLDADDVVLQEDIEKINALKKIANPADVYMLKYVLAQDESGQITHMFYRERIFLRSKNFVWVGAIHEYVASFGRVEKPDIKIYHKKEKVTDPARNLKIYQKMIKNGVKFTARDQFFYARELYFLGRYKQAIKSLRRFLLYDDAWVVNKVQACIDMASCYDLLGEPQKALDSLFLSFHFAPPPSEVTYKIGDIFARLNRVDEAIYWLERAMEGPLDYESGAFVEKDDHDFNPALRLCYLQFVKGNVEKAYEYHLLTKKLKPNDKSVLFNENFFATYYEKNKK